MCLLCACLGFFSTKFFPPRSRQKLDNFFSWIIFLWHSSTPGRKIMWGHSLCWPALKENMQNQTPCGLWVIPQILNSLNPWIWVGLVGIPGGRCGDICSQESAERDGDGVMWVNTIAAPLMKMRLYPRNKGEVSLHDFEQFKALVSKMLLSRVLYAPIQRWSRTGKILQDSKSVLWTDCVPRTVGIRKDEKNTQPLNSNIHWVLPFHQDWGCMKYSLGLQILYVCTHTRLGRDNM